LASVTQPPQIYLDHLAAATTGDGDALRRVWADDGVVEFPYAGSVGSAPRLNGVAEIVGYFGRLGLFGPFTFRDVNAWQVGSNEWFVELHGSSTITATGAAYEQDYVVRFTVAPSGRLAFMREYWDPTRISGA
jgi:uncharacterized protein